MNIGYIGLGRMGRNMVLNLLEKGHSVTVYNRSQGAYAELSAAGASTADSLEELTRGLSAPRVIWIMVPAGPPVDEVIDSLLPHLMAGDTLIDGGNSNYKDSIRRGSSLRDAGVEFLDAGTSGGLSGARHGASITVGGSVETFQRVEELFRDASVEGGYLHTGPQGSGHFVKMVHNGIEYAMLQAYGEGLELIHCSPFGVDKHAVADVWNHGSVIRSWLLELAIDALKTDPDLPGIKDEVGGGETGEWTVQALMDMKVPAPVLAMALLMRYRSREAESYSAKFIAAVRNEFGGHEVKKA